MEVGGGGGKRARCGEREGGGNALQLEELVDVGLALFYLDDVTFLYHGRGRREGSGEEGEKSESYGCRVHGCCMYLVTSLARISSLAVQLSKESVCNSERETDL